MTPFPVTVGPVEPIYFTWLIFSWYSSCTTTRLANATTDIYGAPYEISISICFTFIAGYIRFLNDILRDYHDYNVHDQSPYISNFLRSVDAIITTRTRKRWRLSFRSPSRSHSYPENVGFPLVYEWSFYSTITVYLSWRTHFRSSLSEVEAKNFRS
jgi:hypothetical protein